MRAAHAGAVAVISVFLIAVFCYALIGRQEQRMIQGRLDALNARIDGFMAALSDFDSLNKACTVDVHKVEARLASSEENLSLRIDALEHVLRGSRPADPGGVELGSITISK